MAAAIYGREAFGIGQDIGISHKTVARTLAVLYTMRYATPLLSNCQPGLRRAKFCRQGIFTKQQGN
jgi:hypothetical protein